jgi:hypothetical protein
MVGGGAAAPERSCAEWSGCRKQRRAAGPQGRERVENRESPWRSAERDRSINGEGVKIDIDKLTEAELTDLNNRIVARLRFLSQMRAHAQMLEFKIGDRVSFEPEGHRGVVGMLTRYNRKTVTVITDDGQRWNVSPTLLRRADDSGGLEGTIPNVVPLRRK